MKVGKRLIPGRARPNYGSLAWNADENDAIWCIALNLNTSLSSSEQVSPVPTNANQANVQPGP